MQVSSLGLAYRCFGFVLVVLVAASPTASAVGDGDASRGLGIEAKVVQVESIIGELLGSNLATPEYTDHGGGLHSLSINLDSLQRERLSALVQAGNDAKAISYTFLAAGQSLTPPSNPSALAHAALSNYQLGYNYWVVVINLGSAVTRKTTFRLIGPGRTFNRSFQLLYRADSIWYYWYSAPSVGTPGFYRYISTVAGAGTFTIHTAALEP